MDIFSVSMPILKCRLEEIRSVPELNVLLNNPYFLKLIIHHNQARSRLSFLQHVKLKCASTGLLCKFLFLIIFYLHWYNFNECSVFTDSPVDHFESYIRESRDRNSVSEILFLLKNLLQADGDKLGKNLKKHCYCRSVPLVEIEKSCKLLKKLRFSNKSITEVIQVVLYPW